MFDFDFDRLEEENQDGNSLCGFLVVGLDGSEYNLTLPSNTTVREVKASLEKAYGIPVLEQRICHANGLRELPDHCRLTAAVCQLSLVRVEVDWFSRLQRNPLELSNAPACIRADKGMVQQAAKRDVSAIAYAAAELRGDEDFAVYMAKENGNALRYFSSELRRNRAVVLAAVHNAGSMLKYVDETLQADEEVVLAAAGQDAKALMHASPDLVKDTDFTRRVIAKNRLAAEYVQSLALDSRSRELQRRQEEEDKQRYARDIEDAKITVDAAYALYQRGAIFLDARSEQEFDRSHISGALPFSEQTSVLRSVIMQRGLSATLASDSVVQRLRGSLRDTVIVYSDNGSDDISLGYISRCVRVAQELRRACRLEPSLGSSHRVRRLLGGLNQWKRAGYPTNGEQRLLINNSILLEGGIHACLGLESDM
ncbi:unnamed protein product [Symbiodinium natans]|uniref:Rhodanese domain-containing protein n=1 Tax=Symbiodinium natans TaxID=878477 RepID=A0A812J497_9DINO|nr:unnamed protein product [Symbiodinium natans]